MHTVPGPTRRCRLLLLLLAIFFYLVGVPLSERVAFKVACDEYCNYFNCDMRTLLNNLHRLCIVHTN